MTRSQREIASARAKMNRVTREFFAARDYIEVETPCLVKAPGMEPHIRAFETTLDTTDVGGDRRTLYLHTSPEYAMKRLLSEGLPRIYQLTKVFRSEPPSSSHNPEFTMLEFYCAPGNHETVMRDLEELLEALFVEFTGKSGMLSGTSVAAPFARVSVREAFFDATEVDIADYPPPRAEPLAEALERKIGAVPVEGDSWDDVFFRAFLDLVEPELGKGRAAFLVDYPSHMAALARLKEGDPRWAERFELYIDGLELANGFHELNDEAEQRARLSAEQDERKSAGSQLLPLDEDFLAAVGRMPDAGGVAVGMDRVLMLLTGAQSIEDVLLFPAHRF